VEELLRFIADYEVGIYVIFGIVILINAKRWFDAWLDLRNAKFGMEKEIAQKRIRSSTTIIFLLILLGISNFILVSVASIRVPGISRVATPTIDLSSAQEASGSEEQPSMTTPDVPEQTQTAIALTGCIPDELEWIDPAPGSEVRGSIELKGTVNTPNLGFYKYEFRPQGTETWTPISAGNRPVVDDLFGVRWNTDQLEPGIYFLRLMVSDNQNNLLRPCEIEVRVLPQ